MCVGVYGVWVLTVGCSERLHFLQSLPEMPRWWGSLPRSLRAPRPGWRRWGVGTVPAPEAARHVVHRGVALPQQPRRHGTALAAGEAQPPQGRPRGTALGRRGAADAGMGGVGDLDPWTARLGGFLLLETCFFCGTS